MAVTNGRIGISKLQYIRLCWFGNIFQFQNNNRKKQVMNLPTGNFFEVTINSHKLFSFIEEINKQLRHQEAQLTALSSKINGMVSSVQEETRTQSQNHDIELQKIKKTLQEEVNYVRLFMRDVDKKTTVRISELQQTILLLKDMMMKQKGQLQDDMAIKYSYLDKKISYISVVEEEQMNANTRIEVVKLSTQKNREELEKIAEHYQFDVRKIKDTLEVLTDKVNQNQQDLKNQCEQIVSMRNSFMVEDSGRGGKQRSRQKGNNQNDNQAFINIINRMEEVENKMTEPVNSSSNLTHRRSIISNNKLVKSGSGALPAAKSQFSRSQGKYPEFQSAVLSKLQSLQSLYLQKFQCFARDIQKYSNKAEIADEHIGILSRKLQKQKFKLSETTEQIRHFEDKRIDEKVIENLKNMVKKINKDLQDNLLRKVQREEYEGERDKWERKVAIVNQTLAEKADKSQVKKGLTFLEEKIREIIIVIADQRGTTQDGAIKKVPYKCLSCDKELEAEREAQSKLLAPIGSNPRGSTQQIKKRIRMLNNTVSTVHQDD